MNPYVLTLLYFSVAVIIVVVGLIIFELITTKYKDWHEIEKGNSAVALSIGGKIVGICIILAFSIYNNDNLITTAIWGSYGVFLQIIAYYIFDFLTHKFSVEMKIKEGNTSVGIVSMCVSIGLSFVIGASIT
jgi:putative membrane protein